MFEMNAKRVLIFASIMLVTFLGVQQCWQSKSAAERWLYVFDDAARVYAGKVLGEYRGADVPIPESLKDQEILLHDAYVTFSPRQDPGLVLAFAPSGRPPGAAAAAETWSALGDSWYLLTGPDQGIVRVPR